MNITYSYRWSLFGPAFGDARSVVERLRRVAINLGGVADEFTETLTWETAHAVRPGCLWAAQFTATIPGASEGRFGLGSVDNHSWSWDGTLVVRDTRIVGEFHAAAANLGVEVVEVFAGMVFTSKKNAFGVVEFEQRPAFDADDF